MRALMLLVLAGCSSTSHIPGACDGPCPTSRIRHLIVVVQENHTFDNHFGRYCKAASGSAPTCSDGPDCCEAGPELEPGGAAPVNLDDAAHGKHGPANDRACETDEMNGGKMDRYVTSSCGDPGNFAYADPQIIAPYWTLASKGALADRFFQPLIGASSANDMYLHLARWAFDDNQYGPSSVGHECSFISQQMDFGPGLPDLLTDKGVSWAWYAAGYDVMKKARANVECPDVPDACGFTLPVYPCVYDPADIPFQYEARFRDDPKHFHDYNQLASDLENGTLPQIVFVKAIGYQSEHPGLGTKLSAGVTFASSLIERLLASPYGGDALILLTYDEGGGYFDHVPPPPDGSDGQPYGTRIPLVALGPFARPNHISHVTMELTSLVKFIEWNWLGDTGQLGARDATVANLGSLLDEQLAVPEN